MQNYGTAQFEEKTITLDDQAEPTSRLMPYRPYHEAETGDEYWFEMSAPGHDRDGNGCTVYWEFSAVKGDEPELDTYDYDQAASVTFD